MKLTNAEASVIVNNPELASLRTKPLPALVSYALIKAYDKLVDALKPYYEAQKIVVDTYGAKDAAGVPVLDKAGQPEFGSDKIVAGKELIELSKIEIEIEMPTLKVTEDWPAVTIGEMASIMPLM